MLPGRSIHQSSSVTFARFAWTTSLPVTAADSRQALNALTRLMVLKTPPALKAFVSCQCWLGWAAWVTAYGQSHADSRVELIARRPS